MHKISIFIVLILFLQSLTACGQQTYDEKLESLYEHTVPLIQPKDLAENLKTDEVIILDARSTKEYSVSHLADARFVDYEQFDIAQVKDIPKDAEIVVYCSVGYRSEKIGEKLQDAGFENVNNLYGGLFQWKNEDLQVVNQKGIVTDSVHTYNEDWGQWLEDGKGIKVYE